MYLKCQKLWLSFNTWLIGCLRSLLIKEHVSQGWLIQLGEQGTDRENINLCGVCLPHIIIFQFTLGEKSSWLVNCQSKRSERWDQSEKYALQCCWTCPNKHHESPTGASFTPCGFTPWPATPAFAFHVNIGRNDTLREHGCYYGLPTTQRSSRRGETLLSPRPKWQAWFHLCIFTG